MAHQAAVHVLSTCIKVSSYEPDLSELPKVLYTFDTAAWRLDPSWTVASTWSTCAATGQGYLWQVLICNQQVRTPQSTSTKVLTLSSGTMHRKIFPRFKEKVFFLSLNKGLRANIISIVSYSNGIGKYNITIVKLLISISLSECIVEQKTKSPF